MKLLLQLALIDSVTNGIFPNNQKYAKFIINFHTIWKFP